MAYGVEGFAFDRSLRNRVQLRYLEAVKANIKKEPHTIQSCFPQCMLVLIPNYLFLNCSYYA
ncbi:hypothetical protein F4775DRAFT_578030 [Biscogniauxia sp. FL1348]|nr:hypothetical protein F4775DRAFT_578030 [Biscogniauxia sp. FL1348]